MTKRKTSLLVGGIGSSSATRGLHMSAKNSGRGRRGLQNVPQRLLRDRNNERSEKLTDVSRRCLQVPFPVEMLPFLPSVRVTIPQEETLVIQKEEDATHCAFEVANSDLDPMAHFENPGS